MEDVEWLFSLVQVDNNGRGGARISYLGRCRHESEEQARPLQNLNLQPFLVFIGLQISIEYRYI
jgi:hypothetical protein